MALFPAMLVSPFSLTPASVYFRNINISISHSCWTSLILFIERIKKTTYLDRFLRPLQSRDGVNNIKSAKYGTTSCAVVGNCQVALCNNVVNIHLPLSSNDNT